MVAAAAAVLAAVYFVPSASASSEHAPTTARSHAAAAASSTSGNDLADTGAFNTKPYLIGGSVFLVVGAGLLVDAARRGRDEEGSVPAAAPSDES